MIIFIRSLLILHYHNVYLLWLIEVSKTVEKCTFVEFNISFVDKKQQEVGMHMSVIVVYKTL